MPDLEITPMAPDPGERRVGMSRDQYLALFLEAGDFPAPMQRVQDTRLYGPDPTDRAFARHQGILTGFSAWTAEPGELIFRVVDARWVFPTRWQASAYHAGQLGENSEGMPPVESFPPVGEECRVFGGPAPVMGPLHLIQFFYLFRAGRVVVKLYACQTEVDPTAYAEPPPRRRWLPWRRRAAPPAARPAPEPEQAGETLAPEHVAPIAGRIVARIAG